QSFSLLPEATLQIVEAVPQDGAAVRLESALAAGEIEPQESHHAVPAEQGIHERTAHVVGPGVNLVIARRADEFSQVRPGVPVRPNPTLPPPAGLHRPERQTCWAWS